MHCILGIVDKGTRRAKASLNANRLGTRMWRRPCPARGPYFEDHCSWLLSINIAHFENEMCLKLKASPVTSFLKSSVSRDQHLVHRHRGR
ncbi:hypothetical protein EYF80_040223 [Liparis tanakae]|uniref:Uncharacterized protein n=1 Tax=Liparis tanakae TaxID=230148 RepID=A0A4Z2G991_9TELE|nr:hypothetical protein EYF80_040223 [Liparis tanakae]